MKIKMSYLHDNNSDYDHIPKESIGKYIFNILCNQDRNSILNIDGITGEFITTQKYLESSVKLTYILKNYSLQKGDRVAIVSKNTLNYCIPVLSCLYSGIVVCPINPSYTLSELQYTLSCSKPKLVFCSEEVLPLVLKIKDEVEYIKEVLLLNMPINEEIKVSYLDKTLLTISNPVNNYEPEDIDYIKDDAFILMSSGTTGCPKGVLLNQQSIRQYIGSFGDPNCGGLNSTDVILQVIPLFHIFGLGIQLLSLACSVKVVFLNKFKPDTYLKIIQDHKVTRLFAVPPIMVFLAKTPLLVKYDLTSIKQILVGAAPLSVGVAEELKEKIKCLTICQGYGMTELGGLMTAQPMYGSNKTGSVGIIIPGMSSKICNPDSGVPLKPLETGELCFKSNAMMKGYVSNEGLTPICLDDDGFYHTGDLGYYDHDNNFFLIDRIKELIKYKGFQVAPAELENVIAKHPAVKDCGVTGIPDERAGELPLAFVVKKENVDVTEEEIVKFVAENISVQKQLYGGVKFINEIPKNASGKILRKSLKELLASLGM